MTLHEIYTCDICHPDGDTYDIELSKLHGLDEDQESQFCGSWERAEELGWTAPGEVHEHVCPTCSGAFEPCSCGDVECPGCSVPSRAEDGSP